MSSGMNTTQAHETSDCAFNSLLCLQALLRVLCAASEYDDLPVRHNEDRLNTALAEQVRWPTDTRTSGVVIRTTRMGLGSCMCDNSYWNGG